jgi:eukaryotic-like serine/threonine-protein kinase
MTDPDDSVPVAAPPSRDLAALAMKAQIAAAIFGEEAAPVKVGRYEILETLGVGGMGIVYAAWDESLGRRVALKLLPSDEVGSERERARLAREAQALARLSHPNVVTVYEVGEHDRGVFVAMELVEGVSLQKWQQQRVRTRRELVDVYLQAGRGLSAAHRAGLVHRDFKPANVLVGNDGRVRVVDFGLAQGPGLAAPTTSSAGRQRPTRPVSPVTRTGALVGTPAYMAPEQLAGVEADARADQFGFCVALYEALVGCRPFEVAALQMASERKVPRPTKGSRRLPWLLRRALRRGLAIEPQRRFPDMDALLRAIDADAAWRRRLMSVSGPLALGLGVAWLASRQEPATSEPASVERACEPPDYGPAVDWEQRRPMIEAAFDATNKPFKEDVWLLVERKLSEHAAQWNDTHVQACRASDEADRSVQITTCLDRQARRFEAVLDQLDDVNDESIVHAGDVADVLEPPAACLDPMASYPPSEMPTVPVELLRALDRALVSAALREYETAEAELGGLLASQLVDSPLRPEALLQRGKALVQLGRHEEAKEVLAEAQVLAGNAERGVRAVLAQLELFIVLEQTQAIDLLSQLLDKMVQPLQRPAASYADYLDTVGRGRVETDPKDAVRLHQQALDERVELGRSDDDDDVVQTKLLLANALANDGDPAAARAMYESVLEARRRALGVRHPEYAKVLFNLGDLAREEGRLDAARGLLGRALAIEQAAFDPDSVQTVRTEVVLASTVFALGDHEQGSRLAEHAWTTIQRSELPLGHSDRIAALRTLAYIELELRHHARSLELHRLLVEETGIDGAPDVLHNIAWLQCQIGECPSSRRHVDEARTQVEALLLGERSEELEVLRLFILHTSALVALAEGEPEKARVLLAEVLREAPKYPDHPQIEALIAAATADMQRARRRR